MIQCWTEIEIPPHSVFWMKDILNPCALETPIVRVYRPSLDDVWDNEIGFYEGKAVNVFSAEALYYTGYVFPGNLANDALTNGRRPIPANSRFAAEQLASGIHWVGYGGAGVDPTLYTWFHPRMDSWYLHANIGDGDGQDLLGVAFMRIGDPDAINRCIPVVMGSVNDWMA